MESLLPLREGHHQEPDPQAQGRQDLREVPAVALPNPIRLPSRSVTMIPIAIFPSVACFEELSINAAYSQPRTVEMLDAAGE